MYRCDLSTKRAAGKKLCLARCNVRSIWLPSKLKLPGSHTPLVILYYVRRQPQLYNLIPSISVIISDMDINVVITIAAFGSTQHHLQIL